MASQALLKLEAPPLVCGFWARGVSFVYSCLNAGPKAWFRSLLEFKGPVQTLCIRACQDKNSF